MPVLVMVGENYKIIKESARDLIDVLPNSEATVALHLWNIESPELFNRVLKAWINDETLPEGVELL